MYKSCSATSWSLFTFYVNAMIRKVEEFELDRFLYMVFLLMLMDDTVIFATSRRAMKQKLALFMETTLALHMSCHPVKSKFVTVYTSDTEPFIINDIIILYNVHWLICLPRLPNIKWSHAKTGGRPLESEEVSCQEVLVIPPKELKCAI